MTRRLVLVELSRGRSIAGADVRIVHGVFADSEPVFDRLGAEGARTAAALAQALRFKGEEGRLAETLLRGQGRSLTLVGLGKSAEFTAERARAFVEKAIELAHTARVATLGLVVPEHEEFRGAAAAERLARRLALSNYRFDSFLAPSARTRLKSASVALPASWRRASLSSSCQACSSAARSSVRSSRRKVRA